MEQLSPEQQTPGKKVPLIDLLKLFQNDPEFGERITAVRKAREKADPDMARACLKFLADKYNEFAGPVDKQLIPHYQEKVWMLETAVAGASGNSIQQKLKQKGLSAPVLRASIGAELMTLIPEEDRPADEMVAPAQTLMELFDNKNQLDPYRTVQGIMVTLGADRYEQHMVMNHINPDLGEFEINQDLLTSGLGKFRQEFYDYDLWKQRQFYNGGSDPVEARHYDRRRVVMHKLIGQYHEPKNFKEVVDHFEAPYKNASIYIDLAPGIHRDIHVICFDMLEFSLQRSSSLTPQTLLAVLRAQ